MGLREMYLAKRGCYKLEIGGPNPAIVHEAVVVTLVVYIGFGAQGSSKKAEKQNPGINETALRVTD